MRSSTKETQDLMETTLVEAPRPGAVLTEPTPGAELLDLVLAATNDGVMDWNLVSGVVHYSERWKALLGFEDGDLIESPSLWKELSHPDDLPETEALLRDHIENLWPFAHTWRMRHKHGGWRWSLCRAITIHGERNVPLRCVSVFTDVTDQVLTEQRLSELTRRNALLLTSAGEGFLGIDEAATITFANPAAAQMLKHPVDALIGKSFSQALDHGCNRDRICDPVTCPILRPFADGGVHRVANGSFGRADGSAFTADYVSTPAREDGRVVGVVLTFRDVTEQRRIEAHAMQGQKLEALGQLAAGIAHEINTPMQFIGDNVAFVGTAFTDLLTLVRAYREIVEGLEAGGDPTDLVGRAAEAEATADVDYLEANIPRAIAVTADGIGRVTKIVYAMKDFSHPGGAEKVPADLNRAVEGTVTISANIWRHVAQVETHFDPTLPKVSCFLGEINQVILNLIVNAAHAISDVAKATEGAALGTIRVGTRVNGAFVEIQVSDTGAGIPEHVRHRLFEPFFTTKEVGRGTGQGLTLAHGIVVDRHGGYINFTSELGKGTAFVVGLPLDVAASDAAGGLSET